MAIQFEKNCYFYASKKDFNLERSFEEPKNALHFHYGRVTYKNFSIEYENCSAKNQSLSRKCQAFPRALWVIGEIVYHLVKMIFSGIPKLMCGNKKYLLGYAFYVIRDFQELFGRLVSLFFDQYALYHIEESQFQKKCYNFFLTNALMNHDLERLAPFNPPHLQAGWPNDEELAHEADDLINQGDLAKAHSKIRLIMKVNKDTMQLVTKLADAYLVEEGVEAAIGITEEFFTMEAQDKLLAKLAESFLIKDELETCFKLLKRMKGQNEKDDLLIKLAQAYLKTNRPDECFKIIHKEYFWNRAYKELLLINLAEIYTKNNQSAKALEVIECFINDLFYPDVKIENMNVEKWSILVKFQKQLAVECEGLVKEVLIQGDKEFASRMIKNCVEEGKKLLNLTCALNHA